jgi:hypothetical protein
MLFRVANAVMTLLFLVATFVQYNDPDPVRWMAIYGSSGLLAVWATAQPGGYPWWIPAVIGLIALVWGLAVGSGIVGQVGFSELFRTWHMEDAKIEEARESVGLLIVAFWMAVLVMARRTSSG